MDLYQNKKALDELSRIYLQLDEISADTALAASKGADKKRGQLAAAGDKEGAAKKAKQASDLYKAAAEKRKTETSSSSGGNYPKGKGADYKEEVLGELKKSTLGSYIAKGSKDLADRRFDQGDSEKRKYEPDEKDEKEDKKLDKREQGIARAAKKLSKEGYSNWRDELREISVEPVPKDPETVVKEKNVKNKVVIDPEVKLEQVLGAEKVEVVVEEECPKCHKEDCKCAEIEEEILWDRVARDLTRLGEMGGTKFKVTPFDEAKVDAGKSADEKATARNQRNTPPGADKDTDLKTFITRKPGESLDKARQRVRQRKHAEKRGGSHNKSTSQGQMMSGKGTIYSNEGYQRNPEEGERKERAAAKKREAIPGQASRGMPPRGNKKREEFERWYAANVR